MRDNATLTLDLRTKYDQATRHAVQVLKEANPVKIIRFGSAAWGTLHEYSDLDLCVVFERTDERPIRYVRRHLNNLLWDYYKSQDIEVQLHVYYRDTFDDYLNRQDPLVQEIVKGEVVYEAQEQLGSPLKDKPASYGPSRFAELARMWLDVATQDLAHARSIQEIGFFSHVCFSCQQAAEKGLKAYLFARGQTLVRTHDLIRLLDQCMSFDASFVKLGEACASLNEYYTDTRYPDTLRVGAAFTREEAGAAVNYAETIIGFIRPLIDELLKGETDPWK
jgi:HEPN domain-containing protein/predicted nucleotidyltransferase